MARLQKQFAPGGDAQITTSPMPAKARLGKVSARFFRLCLLRLGLALPLVLSGCRTPELLPPGAVDHTWRIRQGQAVWRLPTGVEVAGDIWLATSPDGDSLLQFSKPLAPLVEARRVRDRWQVRFMAQQKTHGGRGQPPARLVWLQLPAALAGEPLPAEWRWAKGPDGVLRLENQRSREALEVFWQP